MTTDLKPARRKLTRQEIMERLYDTARLTHLRRECRAVLAAIGPRPWWIRKGLQKLEARSLAHGGKTGAGITRPRKLRKGDPPYRDEADALERRWVKARGKK